ncbi:AtpZ/AtpI family protein [Proteiniborus sp. MB09-C3]|uniref:AtpZ/AtpI family protein n=1 Tax=Proteiniborus sp. MB09-C3 TaxID=3050072 RepID=UPI00255736EA|nr:AtpZ/AtpI family protein [Proteiniborus sp. MB09-C3]WIV12185.1 AtpZ/AtpI family protein [Proteiniborus sp. MB09-C3]
MKSNKNSRVLENLVLVSQIGISMIVPTFGGILLGHFIDQKIGTGVIFLAIFTILGIMSSFLTLYKMTVGTTKRK